MQRNVLVKKVKVNFKIYAKQMITIYILSNISRSKGNQTMTFGQVIEYNMRNIFIERSYTKCGTAAGARPFYKISKFCISLDQQSEMLHTLFLLYVQVENFQNTLKLRC